MIKLTFLGVGSAFSRKNATSSILVESGRIKLLVDCGAPVLSSIAEAGLSLKDLTHIFITHLHSDHIGGLEQIAIQSRFGHQHRPGIMSNHSLLDRLWHSSLRGGLEYIEQTPGDLTPQKMEDYFNVIPVIPEGWVFVDPEESLQISIHPSDHVLGMESYSVEISEDPTEKKKTILFTSDTRFNRNLIDQSVQSCGLLLHDCQLFNSGENNNFGVHASYPQLLELPADIRNRIWLYHYGDTPLPDAKKDGFLGFIQHLQTFIIE